MSFAEYAAIRDPTPHVADVARLALSGSQHSSDPADDRKTARMDFDAYLSEFFDRIGPALEFAAID